MPGWVQSAPRQESDYSCEHLCQSAFVSMSHSLSHRWKHPSARALARLSEHSQINQCRKSPHKFQWKMKHQSTLSTINSAWRQLFTVMGIIHHIWDWEAILIITQPLMEGQIPNPATMHTSSCLKKTESLWWIRINFKGGKAPNNTSLVIIILRDNGSTRIFEPTTIKKQCVQPCGPENIFRWGKGLLKELI